MFKLLLTNTTRFRPCVSVVPLRYFSKPPPDYEKMTDAQLIEEDVGAKIFKMVEGTEFDRKLDEMFERMEASGMTEEQIMAHVL